MRISNQWLQEWVPHRLTSSELVARLTRVGLEVSAVESAGAALDKVVVGQIVELRPHPHAAHLKLCRVNVGRARHLTIVCGAPNAVAGMKTPTALIGARLPGGTTITRVRIREVVSSGMLCSAAELGLDSDDAGLLQLDDDAPIGIGLTEYLGLDDAILELELTPNRGDCLAIAGVARELAALTAGKLTPPRIVAPRAFSRRKLLLRLRAGQDCPLYVGRVIEGVNAGARSPDWLRERLRRAGLRSISAIVDITNYVMLELGQPMHAFNLASLDSRIVVRHAQAGETLRLLDGTEITLDPHNMIIADAGKAVALAGIMGGADTAIDASSRDIFLEAAHFRPNAVAACARHHKLGTDASYRFERGVDPTLPRQAMQRAAALVLRICGGQAGPTVTAELKRHLSAPTNIVLRAARLERMLGTAIPAAQVETVLGRLGMRVRPLARGWRVRVPSARLDVRGEHDLIEEVARLVGYDAIPANPPRAGSAPPPRSESRVANPQLRCALVARDYREVITYAFVDPDLQAAVTPDTRAIPLLNPISANMAVMRTSLWPGLLGALANNINRQHKRIRLFELGHVFFSCSHQRREVARIAGLITGSVYPEQWTKATRGGDFFDIKGDVEALLQPTGAAQAFRFQPATHPALHSGQCAQLLRDGRRCGLLGRLHPTLEQRLDLAQPVFVFELDLQPVQAGQVPHFTPISRFPAMRRDLAVLVNREIRAQELLDTIRAVAGETLINLELFDVYHGEGIDSRRKSLAFGLLFQNRHRTMTDQEVELLIEQIVQELKAKHNAELRVR